MEDEPYSTDKWLLQRANIWLDRHGLPRTKDLKEALSRIKSGIPCRGNPYRNGPCPCLEFEYECPKKEGQEAKTPQK